jgi:hypothetical protein
MDQAGIDRRGFLAGGAGGLTVMTGLAPAARAAAAQRPNVLWLVGPSRAS